jgi:hypothetical protein
MDKAPIVNSPGAGDMLMDIAEGAGLRFAVWIELQPLALGRKRCRRGGVGGMIRKMKASIPENGVGDQFAKARMDLMLLEAGCKLCGRCTMEEIMRLTE